MNLGMWKWPGMPRQDPASLQTRTGEFLGLSQLEAGGDANIGFPKRRQARAWLLQAPGKDWSSPWELSLG